MRHPDKQRFINAARHIEQSEIPLFEMEADAAIVNRMLGTDFPLSTRSYDLPVSDLVEWNRLMGNDMVYLSHIWRVGRREQTDESSAPSRSKARCGSWHLPQFSAVRMSCGSTWLIAWPSVMWQVVQTATRSPPSICAAITLCL